MVYVFLADGFETIEALAVVDMLRRAKIDTMTVGVTGKEVKTSHSINVTADITIDELNINDANAIVLPGGMPGTLNLEANSVVQSSIDYCVENGKYVCAICAAPSILGHKGLLKGREAICFPGFEEDLSGATISDKYVVTDGKFITARGAGVAVDFGLEIVKALAGNDLSNKIRETIQCQ
ncbi:MAG: DJ-1 family glyoxalase III [Eubacterium sp.]|nr:DJ-1/PfpI family protein [Eubacterium sp.]MDD6569035.1 DJ-1/PfpI family protein [Eubacteriales bacterium]MDY4110971.1 DJ-1 family glyoxalase III [Eubacterium sp.]